MIEEANPFYLDWQFWSAVAALLAIVLSQLPPVILWFRPRRLEVEVHSRIQITHKVGNPNLSMYVSITNTGGRTLQVRDMSLSLFRDGEHLGVFPAQNYFETPSSQQSVLFVPFTLKPGEDWAHGTNFLKLFDRSTEKYYRANESALKADISRKLRERDDDDKRPVAAEKHLVEPFYQLFEKLFIWTPGEYIVELMVNAQPGHASFKKQYRFTLYETDSFELRSHAEDYPYGGGLAYNVDSHAGIFVPLQQHNG